MKKLIIIALLLASFFIINNLVVSIYNFWRKQDLFVAAQKELRSEKEKNVRLKEELERVKDPEFVEREAREKLFLIKPGEQIVFVPKEDFKNATALGKPKQKESNWKQWLNLFFGN